MFKTIAVANDSVYKFQRIEIIARTVFGNFLEVGYDVSQARYNCFLDH